MSLQSFTRFPDLPMELQMQVWGFAIESADIQSGPDDLCLSITTWDDITARNPASYESIADARIRLVYSIHGLIPLMRTCRLSRLLALEYWYGKLNQHRKMWPNFLGRIDFTMYVEEDLWVRERTRRLVILERHIEQVRQAMGLDEFSAKRNY